MYFTSIFALSGFARQNPGIVAFEVTAAVKRLLPSLLSEKPVIANEQRQQHGGRKPSKTSVTEFWYKSVNLSLEELINIKIILFLIHELFRSQISPKYVTFLKYMTALSAVI